MEDFDPDLDFEVKQQVDVLEIDPAKYQHYIDLRRTHQHLPMAAAAGGIGAIVGALAWLGITAFTSLQVGWMAITIAVIVGGLVRLSGQGIDRDFGLIAAMLTLVSGAAGMLLAGCWLLAMKTTEMAFADLLFTLTPGLIAQIYEAMLTPINLTYAGAAFVTAYWISIRRMRRDELAKCAVDHPTQKKSNSQTWAA